MWPTKYTKLQSDGRNLNLAEQHGVTVSRTAPPFVGVAQITQLVLLLSGPVRHRSLDLGEIWQREAAPVGAQ